MTIRRSSRCRSAWLTKRRAYSSPAFGSWMEHGPTITRSRSSTPSRIARTSSRARPTTSEPRASSGNSAIISCGVGSAVNSLTRRLEVDCWLAGAASILMVRVLFRGCGAGPDQNPPEKWRRAENDLCPVGSEGKLDACQLDAGPSRANEKYAYQRLVIASTIAPEPRQGQTPGVTFRRHPAPGGSGPGRQPPSGHFAAVFSAGTAATCQLDALGTRNPHPLECERTP